MKIAIGCHIMWYEIEMIEEYVQSLYQLVEEVPREDREDICVDFYLNLSQHFEKPNSDIQYKGGLREIKDRFKGTILPALYGLGCIVTHNIGDSLYFIGDYRRDFNNMFAPNTDFLIWGESDCLLPKQTVQILKSIKDYTDQNSIYRYIVTFAVRKMWDDSWKVLEHPKFTDCKFKEREDRSWVTDPSSILYTMTLEEMNEINKESEEIELQLINYPKFDGSGLIISSQLVMAGANIPLGVWACGEDTSFMTVAGKILGGDYKQFVVKNILKVHNRNHPKKRMFVEGMTNEAAHIHRENNNTWMANHNICETNLHNLNNNSKRLITRRELKNEIKKISTDHK
jgi:hypothetical protein